MWHIFYYRLDVDVNSKLSPFVSLQGPEWHSEEFAFRVVLCRSAPSGEDHLAVPLRDPAENQPVRAFIHAPSHLCFFSPLPLSLISSDFLFLHTNDAALYEN